VVDIVEITSSVSDSGSCNYLKLHGYLLKIVPGPFCADGMLPDCRDDVEKGHHFCLPLRLQETTQGHFLCGLVLRRMEEAWGNTYERVGMFRFAEGDSLHLLGHAEWNEGYVFAEQSGDILNTATRNRDLIIV
jgi:hypothetical protein